jgi:hypothetical protein
MGIFIDLRNVMGGTYPKFGPNTCRNKSKKSKPYRDKKYNI